MNIYLLLTVIFLLLIASGGALFYFLSGSDRNLQALMGNAGAEDPEAEKSRISADAKEFDAIKAKVRGGVKKKQQVTLEEKLFRAGLFSEKEQEFFKRLRVICPVVAVAISVLVFLVLGISAELFLGGLLIGAAIGYQVPFSWLDRRILRRNEDILYYLPLVIEQLVVGVSSSLDISPCIGEVVNMADERHCHNPVTFLLKRSQHFMKQGVGLEEAITEIGALSGHPELKHAFRALAQVAKHGGEVTRQLQELADSVATQRETKIDAKIKKLELEATGPVAMVFAGFLVVMLITFGLQVMKVFE